MIRKSNFELLRIICMIMIVTLHTLSHGGALKSLNIHSINFFIAVSVESFFIVAVNCYILISGYFGVNSKFRLKKLLQLYLQVLFYSTLIFLIFIILDKSNLNLNNILQAFLPISMQTWWFISIYFVMYMLSPYINILMKNLDLKKQTYLIIIGFLVFVIWPSIPLLKPIDELYGYSLYNFIYLYIIGAYINLNFKDKFNNKNFWILTYIISSLFLTIMNFSISIFLNRSFGIYIYNFIIVFISSISLFMVFKCIELNSILINNLSKLTLGIYLISDNPNIRNIIYRIFNYDSFFNTNYFIIYTIIIIVFIYITCSLIEIFRQKIFEVLQINDKIYYFIKLIVKKMFLFFNINLIKRKIKLILN